MLETLTFPGGILFLYFFSLNISLIKDQIVRFLFLTSHESVRVKRLEFVSKSDSIDSALQLSVHLLQLEWKVILQMIFLLIRLLQIWVIAKNLENRKIKMTE